MFVLTSNNCAIKIQLLFMSFERNKMSWLSSRQSCRVGKYVNAKWFSEARSLPLQSVIAIVPRDASAEIPTPRTFTFEWKSN